MAEDFVLDFCPAAEGGAAVHVNVGPAPTQPPPLADKGHRSTLRTRANFFIAQLRWLRLLSIGGIDLSGSSACRGKVRVGWHVLEVRKSNDHKDDSRTCT